MKELLFLLAATFGIPWLMYGDPAGTLDAVVTFLLPAIMFGSKAVLAAVVGIVVYWIGKGVFN